MGSGAGGGQKTLFASASGATRSARIFSALFAVAYIATWPAVAADDPAARAGTLLARGKLTDAEQTARSCAGGADEHTAARCRLVLGRVLFSRNAPAEAAAALRPARGKLGALEAVGAQLLGESLLLAGAPQEAQEALREAVALGRDGAAGLRAAALLADALHESGDHALAIAQAAEAASMPGQPAQVKVGLSLTRVRSLAALARAAAPPAGQAEAAEALRAARTFWLEHPDHPAASGMPALEEDLAKLAGAPLPPPTGRELGLRSSRLLATGLPAAAVAQARGALRLLDGAAAAEVELLLARALAADGRRSEATPQLEHAWKMGAPAVAAPAGLLLARDRARRGDTADAIVLLDDLARRQPAAPEAEEAAYLAARLLLEQDGRANRAAALQRLHRLAARKTGARTSDARWTLAWLSFKAHRRDAAALFAAFAAGASDDVARAQGLYWQARVSAPAEAARLEARVASLDPLGWYGVLSAAKTAQAAPPPFPPARPAAASAPVPAQLGVATELIGLGLFAEGCAEVDRYVQQRHGRAADLLPAFALYERAGRYDRSMVLAENLRAGRPPPLEFREPGRAAKGPPDPTGRALLEAAYPAAYPEQVAASARRAGLDPYFILAVARRESLFRPDARSSAGAVGLLQLTPATARRVAAVLGRPAGRDDELFEPGNEIDLGAWYLSELVGRFGDPAIAAAAYNAGPRAAQPWASRAAGMPLDEWVEEIPFRETRLYVKAVAGAWSAYRILAGGTPPVLAETVPAVKSGAEF
jgi:soluble lytic murein transglycosylase